MDEPDVLDVGGRSRRLLLVWLAVLLVIVVGGLGAVRLLGPDQPVASLSQPWPVDAGLPSGTLYVGANGVLRAIDARSGVVANAHPDVDLSGDALVQLSDGVLSWSSDRGTGVLVTSSGGDLHSKPVPRVHSVNVAVPGPDSTVWVGRIDPAHLGRTVRYTLVDGSGAVAGRTRFAGTPFPDGSGGLFAIDANYLAHVYPGPAEKPRPGMVIAVGTGGYLRTRCTGGDCTYVLHDRATGTETEHAELDDQLQGGALSPDNRFVAGPVFNGDGGVSVQEVGSGQVVRSFPGSMSGGQSAVWLSDRWLANTTGDGLVLYDVDTDDAITPALPFDNLSQLVWSPA